MHENLLSCRTLILTGMGNPANLRRAARSRVDGFILKDTHPRDVADAIRTVAVGGLVVDPQLAYSTLAAAPNPLTEREADVLRLTAGGAAPREVAASLHLSYGTVRNYLASSVTKLHARNRVDAIRIATESGWM